MTTKNQPTTSTPTEKKHLTITFYANLNVRCASTHRLYIRVKRIEHICFCVCACIVHCCGFWCTFIHVFGLTENDFFFSQANKKTCLNLHFQHQYKQKSNIFGEKKLNSYIFYFPFIVIKSQFILPEFIEIEKLIFIQLCSSKIYSDFVKR